MPNETLSPQPATIADSPVVFISYAWEGPEMKAWVANLAADLDANGFTVLFDETSHKPGESNAAFMRESCQKADWILCIATPEYKKRCEEKGRGLHFESKWIEERGRIIGDDHVIPLVKAGGVKTSLPAFKSGHKHLDFRVPEHYRENLQTLLAHMGVTRAKSEANRSAGLILICDIDGFSRMEIKTQEAIMQSLWRELARFEKTGKNLWNHRFPLLDGCGLIWDRVDEHAAVLSVARGLAERILLPSGLAALRVGLNLGAFSYREESGKAPHYWGEGLNTAWRAASLGDAGGILITESFYLTASSNGLPALAREVEPPPDRPALEMFPSLGDGGSFRILKTPISCGGYPSRVSLRLAAVRKLSNDLASLAHEFATELEMKFGQKISDMSPRVTLWVPDPLLEGQLCATSHRYRLLEDDDGEIHFEKEDTRSRTYYATAAPGEGPPGLAWANGGKKAVVAHGLPDYATNPTNYVKTLSKFGLRAGKVHALGQKSRLIAACCFPMINDNAGRPVGVICLDAKVPVENASRIELEGIVENLVSSFATDLTLGWNPRL